MRFTHVSLQGALCLISARAPRSRLGINKGTRVGLHLLVLTLDVCVQCLLFSEGLVAWRMPGAVELGRVDVLVSLEPAIRGEALATCGPVTDEGSLGGRIAVGVLQMSLEVVFAGERLVAVWLGAGKGAFLVVAAHVGLEPTGTVEALCAAVHGADIVPLAASLAVGSSLASVGVVDLVVTRRV